MLLGTVIEAEIRSDGVPERVIRHLFRRAVACLALSEARFVTGETWHVDGGFSA